MELNIDMSDKEALVTKAPEARLDQHAVQRIEKSSGLPLWATEVVVTDHTGGEVIKVATAADKAPDVQVGDVVELRALVAIPWYGSGRGGVAYKASSVRAVED